eukprot:6182834-Pleurochrysis_carterae.AAC.1
MSNGPAKTQCTPASTEAESELTIWRTSRVGRLKNDETCATGEGSGLESKAAGSSSGESGDIAGI